MALNSRKTTTLDEALDVVRYHVDSASEQKLQGYDEPEVEINSDDLSDTSLTFDIHINRPCASCGTEAAYYDLSLEYEIEHECPVEKNAPDGHLFGPCQNHESTDDGCVVCLRYATCLANDCTCATDSTFEIDGSTDVESVDDYQTTDPKTGRAIKNSRYQKHLIGARVTGAVRCERCDETLDFDVSDTVAASDFEVEPSH